MGERSWRGDRSTSGAACKTMGNLYSTGLSVVNKRYG